mgnify:CR=1 FL=1
MADKKANAKKLKTDAKKLQEDAKKKQSVTPAPTPKGQVMGITKQTEQIPMSEEELNEEMSKIFVRLLLELLHSDCLTPVTLTPQIPRVLRSSTIVASLFDYCTHSISFFFFFTPCQDSMNLGPEVKKAEMAKPMAYKWQIYKNFKKNENSDQVRSTSAHAISLTHLHVY